MAETIDQLTADLALINNAIAALESGTRFSKVQIGTGITAKIYEYATVNVKDLYAERARIQNNLNSLSNTTPTYRRSSVHRMSWSKGTSR